MWLEFGSRKLCSSPGRHALVDIMGLLSSRTAAAGFCVCLGVGLCLCTFGCACVIRSGDLHDQGLCCKSMLWMVRYPNMEPLLIWGSSSPQHRPVDTSCSHSVHTAGSPRPIKRSHCAVLSHAVTLKVACGYFKPLSTHQPHTYSVRA